MTCIDMAAAPSSCPSAYIEARKKAAAAAAAAVGSGDDKEESPLGVSRFTTIHGRPYYPLLRADPKSPQSVAEVAAIFLSFPMSQISFLQVKPISGGITNQLFQVSGFQGTEMESVLLRVFGAEGMIDRDEENSTYAALSEAGMAPPYFGRFQNGRLEGWLDAPFRAVDCRELPLVATKVAKEMAKLHSDFPIPHHLVAVVTNDDDDDGTKEVEERSNSNSSNTVVPAATLWSQLDSWMKQALDNSSSNKNSNNNEHFSYDLLQIQRESEYVRSLIVSDNDNNDRPKSRPVAFCHNDLLAANILCDFTNLSIQLIDFEYGGINYCAFDIANHWNEYAGGTDTGIPNYEWCPTVEQQVEFLNAYNEASKYTVDLEEVQAFVLANHLYWGLWAVNQAASEGCEDFDYLLYASNRFRQYFKCKENQKD